MVGILKKLKMSTAIKWLIYNALKILFVFPINKKRVIFYSFGGKQYSCNPMYISKYLYNKWPGKYEIIWAVKDLERCRLKGKNCRVVKYNSLAFIFYRITSAVIVTNDGLPTYIPRRKKQLFINTWHGGGGYKQPYKNVDSSQKRANDYFAQANIVLSSSKGFTKNFIRGHMNYKGRVLEIGMPRNDIFINERYKLQNSRIIEQLKNAYHIDSHKKTVMIAPTIREWKCDNRLDYKELLEALQQRFGSEWVILYRGHHSDSGSMYSEEEQLIDVSDYYDMQQLLLLADVLITDYSSCMWDFCFTGKPGFLYVPDLQEYQENHGFDTPIETWPYAYALTDAELKSIIIDYNEKNAHDKIMRHLAIMDNCETGDASRIVCELIMQHCSGSF